MVRQCGSLDIRYVTRYGTIRSIRHKGLKRLHEDDVPRSVIREHAAKLRDILARLDAAGTVEDMTVRANWRVIFGFADGDALDVDYVDYH